MILYTALLSLSVLALHAPKAEPAVFTTSDGVEIVGDYFPADGRAMAPVAILLHQYNADRTSWKPLVPKLHGAGFAVLAIDMRGQGGSTKPESKKLAEGYANRDSSLFRFAHSDVAAACHWLSKQANVDMSMLGLVGASVGCSVALDYAARDKSVDAVVCLSPGTHYMGLDSGSHIQAVQNRAILLLASEGERQAPDELARLNSAAEVRILGEGQVHGTRMLMRFPDLGDAIVAYLNDHVRGDPGPPVAAAIQGQRYFAVGSKEDIELRAEDRRLFSSVEEARARGLDGPDSALHDKLVDPATPKVGPENTSPPTHPQNKSEFKFKDKP